MSKVNFIFASKSPMNMVVKFLIKETLVTKSSTLDFESGGNSMPG